MVTMKKYIKPRINAVEIRDSSILCSSSMAVCSASCIYWRSCQLKSRGLLCLDKKMINYDNN